MYWSILGAIAYAQLTRPDISVFVSALQRHSHAPQIIHAKRLNAVVKWTQRNPKKLCYMRFARTPESQGSTGTHLILYSNAAFRKEEDTGHSMRGALFLRTYGTSNDDMIATRPCHVLHVIGRSQRRVTRSTFTSKMLACCDTADMGLRIVQLIHEINTGIVSFSESRLRRERGGYAVPVSL